MWGWDLKGGLIQSTMKSSKFIVPSLFLLGGSLTTFSTLGFGGDHMPGELPECARMGKRELWFRPGGIFFQVEPGLADWRLGWDTRYGALT